MTFSSGRSGQQAFEPKPVPLPFHARVDAARRAHNPLLEAARVLLDALADTPVELQADGIIRWRNWLVRELKVFGKLCADLQLRPDHAQDARYCLCSALDEAAMQTEWGKGVATGSDWSSNGLAVAFGLDRQGADHVYRILTRAMLDPGEHRDLIELIEHILDLGFKGRYRFQPDGHNKLSAVRQRVRDAITAKSSDSPSQVGQPIAQVGLRASRRRISVQAANPLRRGQSDAERRSSTARTAYLWIVIGILCTAVLGLAGYAAYERPVLITHQEQAVPPIDALANSLNDRLKSEIAGGILGVEENVQHTALTLRFSNMFAPGAAALNPWMRPLIATVGQTIAATAATAKAQVTAKVTGYADNLPVGKSTQASNLTLSEERAKQVTQILLAAGVAPDRVTITGKGDADPVAANDTPEGRMRNRRVEIVVSE